MSVSFFRRPNRSCFFTFFALVMAQLFVDTNKLPEEGEIPPSDSESGTNTPKTPLKRRSRYDVLEEQWNQKFSALESSISGKLDGLVAKIQSAQSQCNSSSSKFTERHVKKKNSVHRSKFESGSDSLSDSDSDSNHPGLNSDILSIHGDNFLSDEDNVSIKGKVDEKELSDSTKKCLFDIFGEDATVKKSTKKEGISVDNSQKDVLNDSLHSTSPNFLSAFNEENFDLFPVDEETEKFLQVPTLDPLIESLLVNRHGSKAAFKNSQVKCLFSQPHKTVEKVSYRGAQAARLGIVMQLYMQQALGNLVEFVSSDDFSKDKTVKFVKDIFAMSTKCLDQLGRSAAFHHIVRRTVTMADTGMYDLSDYKDFATLPLTGDGVFGNGLEPLLKARKDKKKQLDDMLPELKKRDRKRRLSPVRSSNDTKRLRRDIPATQTSSGWDNNFRIPKIPSDSHTKGQNFTGQYKKNSKPDFFPKRSYGRKMGRSTQQ
ncbi:uncharacterized protein LOC132729732 [Ruditapes philippinarum]|uniref:uncharacterized protein LOC132729732 n=2 Tax=Ruditapes philippinarum TaxID=129788 RepID=UPI00295C374D|nr:uncharacterized protein LOC132729732 [Ruditapes philippinarum]